MKLAVVLYNGLSCNSALHVRSLLESMIIPDDSFTVVVPDDADPGEAALPPGIDCRRSTPFLADLKGGEAFDLLVAWTPRENVRPVVQSAARICGSPYAVHLEDNEDAVTARHMGYSYKKLLWTLPWKFRHLNNLPISNPWRMRLFLRRAAGVSALMDRLTEGVPSGIPTLIFWPGYDESLFGVSGGDPAGSVRERYEIPAKASLLVYTGNIHRGNVEDMRDLYRTVATLNRLGRKVHLLRSGETHVQGFAESVAESNPFVHETGFLERKELPALLSAADILVQPGRPGVFNDFRFPSKLPEFLVSAKPVVISRSNIGRFLTHGAQAYIVKEGSPGELADAVMRLLNDPSLASRIGAGGKIFAEEQLRWGNSARTLREFWAGIINTAHGED